MYFCLISFNTKHFNRKFYWSFCFSQIPNIGYSLGNIGLYHLPVSMLSLWLIVTNNKVLPLRAHGYIFEALILTRRLSSSRVNNQWMSQSLQTLLGDCGGASLACSPDQCPLITPATAPRTTTRYDPSMVACNQNASFECTSNDKNERGKAYDVRYMNMMYWCIDSNSDSDANLMVILSISRQHCFFYHDMTMFDRNFERGHVRAQQHFMYESHLFLLRKSIVQ